jgi:hypothetical protein
MRFEIAVPPGFAIYASRTKPVAIAVSYVTGGLKQHHGSVTIVRKMLTREAS